MSISRCCAAVMLGLVVLLSGAAPAAAAPLDARAAADADAYRNRFIVVWKDAPARMSAASVRTTGVASAKAMARPGWSIVRAERGKALEVAARLRKDPRVLTVVPDAKVTATGWPLDADPSDPWWASQGDLRTINVAEAWKTSTGSPSVTVAVIDSGMDTSHEDLVGVPLVAPRNEITNTVDVRDEDGHGTHVAGTIAARTNNGLGVAGIAPGVSLMPVKVLGPTGGSTADVLDGISWAVANGADVINLSLAGISTAEQIAIEQAVVDQAHAAGVVIVAAAGNENSDVRSFPAALNHVMSVAAVDEWLYSAEFSNYGPTIDIAAPGTGIVSTTPGNGYTPFDGTSMASPHVAAAAALLRSARPELTADQVEAVLRTSAADLGLTGRDDLYGDGLLDVGRAMTAPVPNPMPVLDAPAAAPFTLSLSPDSEVRLPAWTTSQSFSLASTKDISMAGAGVAYWPTAGGACPGWNVAPSYDWNIEPSWTMSLDDVEENECAMLWVEAIDTDGLYAEVVSPVVYGHDYTPPRVTSRTPVSGARRASVRANILAVFSENVVGVSGSTVKLRNVATGRLVPAVVSYNATYRRVTVNPVNKLRYGTVYKVTIRSGVRDTWGNPIATTSWRFRTRLP